MAAHCSEAEIDKLKKQFLALDEDGSGLVTIDELKSIFKESHSQQEKKSLNYNTSEKTD